MAIHHMHAKRASKAGFSLTELESGMTDAFWPKLNLHVFGQSPAEAIQQMEAAQWLVDFFIHRGETALFDHHPEQLRLVNVRNANDYWLVDGFDTPFSIKTMVETKDAAGDGAFFTHTRPNGETEVSEKALTPKKEIARKDGIPIDGGDAYREGVMAAGCPYSSEEDDDEYEDFIRWNDEWDAAADEATDEEKEGGSVVKSKYRARYAELGHPTHCGDWLAELLNNLVLTKKSTDIERFEAICAANEVDMSRYNKESKGWQGRFRMTGRNLLAKKVYKTGVLVVPAFGDEPAQEFKAPADWIEMQKYKKG